MFNTISGGYEIRPEDDVVLRAQRSITKKINDNFIQVGAVWLKMSGKLPIDGEWAKTNHKDTQLQDWIDDPDFKLRNAGFNLQFGWTDIDIDVDDPEYNACLLAALDHLGVDTRFRFGRRSVGYPTHVLVQLGEAESSNFELLRKFEPKEFRIDGKRYKTQIRSYSTNTPAANVAKTAQQTVMPGSIYSHKKKAEDYDLSVWYGKDGIAQDVRDVAATTPRRVAFNEIVRAIAFATMLYVVKDNWVQGQRHETAAKICGWLARVVKDSQAMNNHESIAEDVFCPVDDDTIVESMIHFICNYMQDEEPHMRIRTYYDAQGKLERNPDAKIPGWPAMELLFGGERVLALRAVFTPGSDVSILNVMAERYVYDETDSGYIDRKRHLQDGRFVHENGELYTRHKGDVVRIGGKPREAFKVYESSDMRKRVDRRDLYPDLTAGGIFRINIADEVMPDETEELEDTTVVFNTWRGWPIKPTDTIDEVLMTECVSKLDRLLGYMTQDHPKQIEWFKDWVAWTFQHPGKKQQIAPVVVGGQGVGKSFFGNNFMKGMMGRLWGSASPKVMDTGFSVEPFVDKMFVFIDEAKFHGEASTDEIKKLIRNIDVGGAEKFQSARNFRIFARLMFASNRFDVGVGQSGAVDRALFYCKAYDHEFLKMTELEFRSWSETLKPWFAEYAAFLQRRDVREHYVRYFMDRPVEQQVVESIKHSSINDPTIITANMSWPRQVAKRIIEEGWIIESTALETPFLDAQLNDRVNELVKQMGMRTIQGSRVMHEFEQAGIIETVTAGFKKYKRFTHNIGAITAAFGAAIGVELNSQFEFNEEDMGPNTTKIGDRKNWKGQRDTKF
jgi:hypothetical protein